MHGHWSDGRMTSGHSWTEGGTIGHAWTEGRVESERAIHGHCPCMSYVHCLLIVHWTMRRVAGVLYMDNETFGERT